MLDSSFDSNNNSSLNLNSDSTHLPWEEDNSLDSNLFHNSQEINGALLINDLEGIEDRDSNNLDSESLLALDITGQALAQTRDYLSGLQSDITLDTKLELAFGDNFNEEIANDLIKDFSQHDFSELPTIKLVDEELINNANGAYSTTNEFIYLSQEFVTTNQNNLQEITDVLLEEIGHFIDDRINETDSVGDEGELFSALVRGETLSAVEIANIKADDDLGEILIEGKEIAIEYASDNITFELVDRVLSIKGTEQNDEIQIVANEDLALYRGEELIQTFDRSAIDRIQILALDGDDTIDLTTVDVDTWVYGGQGNDRVIGGTGSDLILGMGGQDTLQGNDGDDILYGGEGQPENDPTLIDGGLGSDRISFGTGEQATNLPAEDIDIEALDYEDRVYFDLLNRYRDAHGFVISHGRSGDTLNGELNEQGDAVIFTGLAAATSALRGDSASTRELLEVLRDGAFVDELGQTRLIRHPEVWDYIKQTDADSGEVTYVRDRQAPLTKDGVVGVITGLYYAYKADGITEDVRELAKEVLEKYVDYLIGNQWKTVDSYPDHYIAEDGGKFENVFSNEIGGRVSWKGPEGYLISPSDRYALQNIAAEMGLVTSGWKVWEGFAATATQVLGDAYGAVVSDVADSTSDWIGEQFDNLLQQIKIDEEYSFHVIPGLDWTLVKGDLNLEISQSDRDNIVSVIESGFREIIQLSLQGETVDGVTEFPAQLFQANDLLGRVVDKIVEALPSWASNDRFRDLVTDTIQQVMPWLTGDVVGELVAFRLSHEFAKRDNIAAHLSFWPTLLMYETRPEIVDLLRPSVADVNGHLNGRMDMELYEWLSGDANEVNGWLERFESDPRLENLKYAWKKPATENSEDIELGDTQGQKDTGRHRLDYLLLNELDERGVPESLSETVGDWLDHWEDVLEDIGERAEQAWIDLKDNVVGFTKALVEKFNVGITDIFQAVTRLPEFDLVDGIKGLIGADLLANSSYEVAKFLLNEAGQNLATTALTIKDWLNEDSLLPSFNAIAYGAGKGVAKAISGLVGADLLANSSYEVAKFLLNESGRSLSTTANTIKDWLGTGSLVPSFNAIAYGAGKGVAKAISGLVGAELLANSSYKVAKFLLNESGRNLATTALAIKDWLNEDSLIPSFNAIAYGAGKGTASAISGLVGAGLLANSSYEVAKFLLNESGRSLSTTANTIKDWLGSNSLIPSFNAIAYGAGKGTASAISGLVGAGLLANSSYEVAKFLLNESGRSLSTTANTIKDWLGTGSLVPSFNAIAYGAGKGTVDAIRGLVGGGLLGGSYSSIYGFLSSTIGFSTAKTLSILRSLF